MKERKSKARKGKALILAVDTTTRAERNETKQTNDTLSMYVCMQFEVK